VPPRSKAVTIAGRWLVSGCDGIGEPMLRALILALRQLNDPPIRRVLVRCVLLALATFAVLLAVVPVLISYLDVTGFGWLDATLAVLGSAAVLLLAWLLFPAAVALGLGLFADEVVDAVERRHYPGLPPATGLGITMSVLAGLRLGAMALLLNLLVLPFYLVPGANLLIFLALNGYLLGREYFETVATRRMSPAQASAQRRAARGRVWSAGVVIAALSAVPFLNLIAPVIGVAFMTHLFADPRWPNRGARPHV
jgi:CysZ protein